MWYCPSLIQLIEQVLEEHKGTGMTEDEVTNAVNYKISQWPLYKQWFWRAVSFFRGE